MYDCKNNALPKKVSDNRAAIVTKLVEMAQNDELDWSRGWVNRFARPYNPISKHFYQGCNLALLSFTAIINDYNDRRWMTYNQAKANGWQVRKGEKGTIVEKWSPITFTKEDKDGNEKVVSFMKCTGVWYVFNAAQIDGIPAEEPCDYRFDNDTDINEIADRFIATSRCPIHESTVSNEAYYMPYKDEVVVPSRLMFNTNKDFLATLLHEMTHSTAKPLARKTGVFFGSERYSREELVAELGSMFVTATLGLEMGDDVEHNHAAYIQNWLRNLAKETDKDDAVDPNDLFRAASKASKACDYLMDAYEGKDLSKYERKETKGESKKSKSKKETVKA